MGSNSGFKGLMLDILQQNVLVTNNYMVHTPSERYMTLRCKINASRLYSKVPCTWQFDLMFVDPCIIIKFIKKNPTRCNSVSNFYYSILYEAQHVLGDTPLIIRSLKLHWQPLVFHTWKVVGRVVVGRCQARYCDSSSHIT